MATVAIDPRTCEGSTPSNNAESLEAAAQIMDLVARQEKAHRPERRGHRRVAYPQLIEVIPLDAKGNPLAAEAFTVVGKNISEQGIGFFHCEPICHRNVVARLETSAGQTLDVLVDLRWCRFARKGWYESGGRLLGAYTEQQRTA